MPNLTEKFIASLGPREGRKQYDVYGSRSSGLGLCYSNGGARTWFVFWRDAEGKSRRTSIGRHDQGLSAAEAKSRARAKLAEIEKEVAAGVNRPTERHAPTMGALIDRYLEHAADHAAPSTLRQFRSIAQCGLTQELRAQKLRDFDREQIEELHGVIGRTRGRVAANNWYRFVRMLFNLGVDWKMVDVNPCRRVKLFKENMRTRPLSRAEVEKLNVALLQELDWRWRGFFPLLLLTGLRKSELMALTWNRVDFDQRTLTVVKRKNRKPLIQPLADGAVQILEGLPSRGVSEYVFPGDREGGPIVNPDDAWQRIRARAGLNDVRIHDCRHSFASFLINANVPLSTVSKALGHSSIVMSQRYAHLEQQTVRDALAIAFAPQATAAASQEPI